MGAEAADGGRVEVLKGNVPLALLAEIQDLHKDAKLGKHRHFIAADRKQAYATRIGIAGVVLNVFTGSQLAFAFRNDALGKVLTSGLAFAAAALAGLQTFFKFQKDIELHRKVGNLYVEIARGTKNLIGEYNDGFIDKSALLSGFEQLTVKYTSANEQGESCPSSPADYTKAKSRVLKVDSGPEITGGH